MSPLADFFLLSKEQILQKADKLRAEGKPGKAAELLASGLKNNTEDFELLLALAGAHQADEKGRDAASALKNAISLAPARSKEVLESAEELFYNGNRSSDLGDLAFEMNISRRNIEPAVKILKTLPDRDIDAMLSRYGKVKESLDRYRGPAKPAGTRAKDMGVFLSLALLYYRKGQPRPAFDLLDAAAQSPDEYPPVNEAAFQIAATGAGVTEVAMRYGDVLIQTGQRDKALELYSEAAKVQDPQPVIDRLKNFLEKEPDNTGALALIIQLYLKKQQALPGLEAAKRLWKLDQRHRETILAQLREILKLDPQNTDGFMFMGDCALEALKPDLAMTSLARVAELAPELLSQVLDRYHQILEKSPGNFEAATRIIDAYSAAGQTDQVVKSLRDMVSKDATLVDLALEKLNGLLQKNLDQPLALEFLAECYLLRPETLKAARVYQYLAGLGGEWLEKSLSKMQGLLAKEFDQSLASPLIEALIKNNKLAEAVMLGAELGKRNPLSWPEFLPLLDSASPQADPRFNQGLAKICQNLEQQGQDLPVIHLVKAAAWARSGEQQAAAALFLQLHQQPELSRLAKDSLMELAREFPQSGQLQLTLAELHQRDAEPAPMAAALLAAAASDKSLLPQVSLKLQELLRQQPDDLQLQILQMELLYQQRLLDKAFDQANAIAAKWPGAGSAKAYLRLGQIYLEKGELTKAGGGLMKASELDGALSEEALLNLKKLLEIDDTSLPGHYAQAKVLLHLKKYDRSLDELLFVTQREPRWAEKILADIKDIQTADPANHRALVADAQINMVLQNYGPAASALSQALELAPEIADQVAAFYRQMLSKNPDQPQVKMALAKSLVVQNTLDEAVALIEQALSREATLAEPAIGLLRQVLQRDKENIAGLYLLARIYAQRNAAEQSVDMLRQILEISEEQSAEVAVRLQAIIDQFPQVAPARYLLAELQCRTGRYDLALAEYEAVVKARPEDRARVLGSLDHILEQHPNQAEILFFKSRLLAESGDLKASIAGLVRVSELDPSRRTAAAAAIERMMAQHSDLPEIYEALGIIYFEMGKFPQARDLLSGAVKMVEDPERKMRVLFFLAESYLALRQEDKAEEIMNQVRQLNPDADEVFRAMRRFNMRRMQVEVDKSSQALQEAPDDEFRKLDLAGKLLGVGKHDTAVSLLAFKPQSKETAGRRLLLLARAFLGRGEAVSALEVLRAVPLSEHPFNRFQMDVCYLLGQCYEYLGNYAAAVAAYRMIYLDQTDFRDVKRRMEQASGLAVLKELGRRSTALEALA
ncbi:tetratricopeptide repeat protein [candidate division TA06 bacterium]|uniref:Tetratricopeptide repeat protein n=1 Tax=candidate division TA06 bacterium TaxID=2250710 RepID=A0A933IBW3_UNCT6|nr:tetratricopeptide repeat protein [candidate division TA06 bacterium]